MSKLTATQTAHTGDIVTLTRTTGEIYFSLPVLETRTGGFRLGVRSGFGPQDLFIPFGDIASIATL